MIIVFTWNWLVNKIHRDGCSRKMVEFYLLQINLWKFELKFDDSTFILVKFISVTKGQMANLLHKFLTQWSMFMRPGFVLCSLSTQEYCCIPAKCQRKKKKILGIIFCLQSTTVKPLDTKTSCKWPPLLCNPFSKIQKDSKLNHFIWNLLVSNYLSYVTTTTFSTKSLKFSSIFNFP